MVVISALAVAALRASVSVPRMCDSHACNVGRVDGCMPLCVTIAFDRDACLDRLAFATKLLCARICDVAREWVDCCVVMILLAAIVAAARVLAQTSTWLVQRSICVCIGTFPFGVSLFIETQMRLVG